MQSERQVLGNRDVDGMQVGRESIDGEAQEGREVKRIKMRNVCVPASRVECIH